MDVLVISATIQEYSGVRYYLCGLYYQHKGKRLHRIVWETEVGPIPSGYHVHHKTGDRSRNNRSDLELLPKASHLSIHSSQPANRERSRRNVVEKAVPAARAWHGTPAGHAWHSQNALSLWQDHRLWPKDCMICGVRYETPFPSRSKYCGNNCRAKATRMRHRG